MINNNWDFEYIVSILETLEDTFSLSLASFSKFDKKKLIKYKRAIRDSIYSLKFDEFKKNLIWEYLNGYEDLDRLEEVVRRENERNHKTHD